MILVAGGRQTGKTARVMRELHSDPNAVLLVRIEAERQMLLGTYAWPGIEEQIYSVSAAMHLKGRQVSFVHVDNLDLILPQLLGIDQPLGSVTFTGMVVDLGPSGDRPF